MRILIFGAGAVGQAVGGMLSCAGIETDLVVRERFVSQLRVEGIRVEGILGKFYSAPGKAGIYSDPEEVAGRHYDFVLVTVKSNSTAAALDEISGLDIGHPAIVMMQNGCGNVEQATKRFPDDRVLGARVITGFEIPSTGRVRITVTAGDILVGGTVKGDIPAAADKLSALLRESGLPSSTTDDIRSALFSKMFYNCTLNPLSALLRVCNGALGDDPGTREIMDRVIEEVFRVGGVMNIEMKWKSPEEVKKVFYNEQVPATYNHTSSMLQDIMAGRRTEIGAMNGYISKEGRRRGIPTPACDMLTALVEFLERAQQKQ